MVTAVQKITLYLSLATPFTLFCAKPAQKPPWSQSTLKRVVAMQLIYDNATENAQALADLGHLDHYIGFVKCKPKWSRMQDWLMKNPKLLQKTLDELAVIIADPKLAMQFLAAVKKDYNRPNIIL